MSFKIDIEHRGRFLTFGPRFKGEIGKDIFAAKIALGILRPAPSSSDLEPGDAPELSFDPAIPLDEQKWFDCKTGLGVDLAKATRFDTTLENALITFQLNNQFLITSYYFEKVGFLKLLNTATSDKTLFEAEVASQMLAAMGLFDAELRTLGEATIAVMHGWLPGTKLKKNTAYTHDSAVYTDTEMTSDGRLPVVIELLATDMYVKLLDPQYSQNFQQLVSDGIAVPNSLTMDNTASFIELESTRAWAVRAGLDGQELNFAYGTMKLYPILNATSALYNAATQVVDYYLENDLFSQTLSQQEIDEQARRAIYPDPFSTDGVFTIDGTRLGIYTETDYLLSADGPLPPSNLTPESGITKKLEEAALLKALADKGKPQIWYFVKDEEEFQTAYFSRAPAEAGTPASAGPNHDGEYPSRITLNLSASLRKHYGDLYSINDPGIREFYSEKIWVLTTDNIIEELEPEKAQHWRTIESQGRTKPLISFKEFISPSLRPGQKYRALFEINRQKFDLINDGEALQQQQQPQEAPNTDPTPESVCLDQNSAQTQRSYEEYRAHAIKRRRELVRKIREIVRSSSSGTTNVNTGFLGDLDLDFGPLGDFNNLNMNNASDYEVMQRLAQVLPGQELVDFITGFTASSKDRKLSDPNNDTNNLEITVKELKERIDKAVEDLKEAQDIITRERIKFQKGTDFDGHNEAVQLSSLFTDLVDREFGKKYDNLSKDELQTVLIWDFRATGIGQLGHRSGKNVTTFDGGETVGSTEAESKVMFPRPRTNNYLSLIRDMTGKVKISGFFDDSRNSCKDLGINIDKITAFAYVRKYTSGLQTAAQKEDEFSFKSWFADNIGDPITEFGQKSGQNFMDSFDGDNFPEDAALRALGQECNLEKVWLGALDKLDLVSLLCDYIKCIKLPPFDFKAPDFRLPPLPKVSILGWYAGFYRFVRDNWLQILTRLACTASKIIIDKLAFPLCEEQLQEFIQSDLLSEGPYARKAVIDSLTQTGVPDADQAKDFFDATANILTGRELCYILNGNMPDDATMAAISRLADTNGISQHLETPEDIINFFGVVGIYLPSEICDQLDNQTVLRPTNCDDTNDLLRGVRNRLQTGDSTLSDEEINRVVAMAEQSKQEEADRLKSFLDNGFEGSVPPIFQYGNKNSPMSDFPEHYKREQEKSAEALFQSAKKSYGEGLAQYVPSMFVRSPVDMWPYDERYDEYTTLRLEAAIQQIQDLGNLMPPPGSDREPPSLGNQFAALHRLYETETIDKLPGYLIPPYIKKSLEPTGDGYRKLPQASGEERNDRTYEWDDDDNKWKIRGFPGGGVVVHKRMILPKDGQLKIEDIAAEVEALNVLINRFSVRINRVDGLKKKRRLRGKRRSLIERRDKIKELLEDPEENGLFDPRENIVPYEYFMLYQQEYDTEDFKNLNYEFGLVPLPSFAAAAGEIDTGTFSMNLEYTNFKLDPRYPVVQNHPTFLGDSGTGVTTLTGLVTYFRNTTGFDGNDTDVEGSGAALEKIIQRSEELQRRIIEILTNMPTIIDEQLFTGLQQLVDRETEVSDERDESLRGTTNQIENLVIKFPASARYSPKITLREIPAAPDKDRYDIEIKRDFFIGMPQLDNAPAKTFRYCDQLPDKYLEPTRYTYTESQPIHAKRYRFQNMVIASINKLQLSNPLSTELEDPDERILIKEHIPDLLYRKLTKSIIENLMDELSESYLFEAEEVELLDRRVVGKRQINECISNRFSFGKNSVVSFNKTILGNVSMEIAKEMAKPENSPENYDFDSPSGFDKAMQNLAFRGFVSACLIDIMLKGGLAYSRWDIETIVEDKFFIDYSISHVLNELSTSSELATTWRRNIEQVMGISNSKIALELLVKQELVKLPNYSKQVFHPNDNTTNFYDWFLERKIRHFHVSRHARNSNDMNDRKGYPFIAQYNHRVYKDDPLLLFTKEKPLFLAEHYIKINGIDLVRLYLNATIPLSMSIDQRVHDDDHNYIILNVRDFMELSREVDEAVLNTLLQNSSNSIEQGMRIVLLDTQPANTVIGRRVLEENERQNEFINVLDPDSNSTNSIRLRGECLINQSLIVAYRYDGLSRSSLPLCFAIPMVEYERTLDFQDCYSILEYNEEKFQEAIPFMNQEISKLTDYSLLLEHIFPTRRFMSMASVFATSVVSGYNSMPSIMTPTKSALASLVRTLGLGRVQRANLQSISQDEFVKQLTENFPADEGDCIDFPGGFEDMFKKFFEELWKLIKKMPSIVFRGVANQIDPAYKEMRQHYINCDINHLTYRGLRPFGTTEYKLTNGLHLSGRTRYRAGTDAAAREARRLQGRNKGKYVPFSTGLATDFVYSLFPLQKWDFVTFGARLGVTISKLVSYIYSSNRPMLDPSAYFKIPCADIDVGAWRDQGKYDAGLFGRYGHPLSPFTLLALATPQLETDKRTKENNCRDLPEECVEIDTGTAGSLPEPERENRLDYNYFDSRVPEIECRPWTAAEIVEIRNLIKEYYEPNRRRRRQELDDEWEEMRWQEQYYDNRSGVQEGQEIPVSQGSRRDFREDPENHVFPPISAYVDQSDFDRYFEKDQYNYDPYTTVHPQYYDMFHEMWLEYERLGSELRNLSNEIKADLRNRCREFEDEDLSDIFEWSTRDS